MSAPCSRWRAWATGRRAAGRPARRGRSSMRFRSASIAPPGPISAASASPRARASISCPSISARSWSSPSAGSCSSAIVDIAKRQNITSIADFIAARYGKNEMLGALVALIAVVGIIPYISIQLKAVSFALETMMMAPGWSTAGARALADQRGHRLLRHRRHGGLRHAVRHPPHRHDRASAWPDDWRSRSNRSSSSWPSSPSACSSPSR